MGISLPTNGKSTNCPFKWLYRVSLGWNATAVSPSIVPGLGVATMTYSDESLIGHLIYQRLLFISLYITSSSLIADFETGHQFTILFPLYIIPFS